MGTFAQPCTTQRYSASLSDALTHFRTLWANPHSRTWKPISLSPSSFSAAPPALAAPNSTSTSTTSHDRRNAPPVVTDSKGKARASPSAAPSLAEGPLQAGLGPLPPQLVRVHRKADKDRAGCEIVRAVAEVAIEEGRADEIVERARAVLGTGEVRALWDKLVEQQTTLELLDSQTRIVKTDYRLGWPASPRDTITISRTFLTPSPSSHSSSSAFSSTSYYSPGSTLIDLSTSLPRAPNPDDEPAFLRPAPPYVRAHLYLGAWALQVLPPSTPPPPASTPGLFSSPSAAASLPLPPPQPARLRITLFWQWNLRLSSPSSSLSHSPSSASPASQAKHAQELVASFVALLRGAGGSATGEQLPLLRGYGAGVEMNGDEYDLQAETRGVEYAVVQVPPASGEGAGEEEVPEVGGNLQGLDELARRRERRRLERSVELSLPALGVTFSPLAAAAGAAGEGEGTAVLAGGGAAAGGSRDGWDVRIAVKALGGGASSSPSKAGAAGGGGAEVDPSYSVSLSAAAPSSSSSTSGDLSPSSRLTLRITHAPLSSPAHLVRATITVQRLAGGRCVRVNGVKVDLERVEMRDPLALLSSAAGLDADEAASLRTGGTGSSASPEPSSPTTADPPLESGVSLRSRTAPSLSPPSAALARQQALTALLRRSYIYFLSLLQEPPAKWRHVSDSSGVSVTQLLSPDPTLTIYRAEAVFVGVGVWDVYATVVSQGVRRCWDKGIERVELVPEGGEEDGEGQGGEEGTAGLSEVWWERRKGQWPVAPRDSVLLRTSYKSPSSIHVFSSSPPSPSANSADASSTLFPYLPAPAPGTIRTHTDLSGWSIEALSPTTTQITLLDQSDPKGWTTKSSWTPSALIQAVAGVRDFSIRYGAPPVVTRLSGGVRKVFEEYDPDKAALRVEYAPYPSSPSSASPSLASPPASPDPAVPPSSIPILHAPAAADRTELEIRCDATTWASPASGGGIDVVVDPPPLSVAVLSRHRLSAGGGLWLTIEHARGAVVAEGKVAVTVRRASSSPSSSAAGAGGAGAASATTPVTVNGARVKVDVEVLDDDKVRELEKRKRVKARPVPLDQYETLGPRGGAAAAVAPPPVGSPPSRGVTPAPQAAGSEKEKDKGKAVDEAEQGERSKEEAAKTDSPVSTAAGETSTAVVDSPVVDPVNSVAFPSVEPTKPPLDPPAVALEALAWLQTFHAEQGPELTDPAPGWAIATERGGAVVRKKLLPSLSPDLPTYRGDKIVQGLTADEIAAVVTAPSCRKAWDERIESAVPLASYGHGISTTVLTTKPAFPFKGRVFYVASVNASVKVPSASSAASTSTVRFVASASYVAPPNDPLDPLKVNPNSLPSGQVYLEGWILETLDPYTSSVLAIPSTRCTFVACVDPKLGNLALGFGNVNLARTIAQVEQLGKTKGPLPRLASPTNGVQIEGPLTDDGEVDCVWKLQKDKNGGRSEVVAVDYDPGEAAMDKGTFRALFRVGGKGKKPSLAAANLLADNDATPVGLLERKPSEKNAGSSSSGGAGKSKPSPMLSPSMPVGTTLLKSELPRSASLNFGTAAPPILQKPPITSELAHKSSRGSLRSRSPPGGALSGSSSPAPAVPGSKTANGSSTTVTDPAAHDLVVAELVIDLKQFPHGYSVTASSLLLPAVSPQAGADEPLSLEPLPPRSLAPSASISSSSSSTAAAAIPTQIPLRCTAHDAPLPSILTASLDAWKRANHLLRVLVPTGAITHPIQDPLRTDTSSSSSATGSNGKDGSSSSSNKLEWFRLLTDGEGALVEIKVVPLPAPPPSTTAAGKARERERARVEQEPSAANKVTGQAARSAVFNGEKVVVLSQKESKAVLAKFEDDDAPLQGAKISRVPPRKRRKSSVVADVDLPMPPSNLLPPELQQPLAIATRLLAPKPVTPQIDDFEFPDPKSPGNVTPADDESRSPVLGKKPLKPVVSRRDTASSSDGQGGPLLNILNAYPLSRLGTSVINATAPMVSTETSTTEDGAVAVRRTYTLHFVLLVAVISFLLGSLLRSLLTPADYIIYRPESAAQHGDVEQALLQAFDPHRRWREARRLLELRSAWSGIFSWDIIVAAVKRE
ncbi:hypothetical protein JCM8097_008019 [Rhodosporidiobolus ruineniae]